MKTILTLDKDKNLELSISTAVRIEIINIESESARLSNSTLASLTALKEINVKNENHWFYKSVDGILYTRDMRTLIHCPAHKEFLCGIMRVPDGVEEIASQAFYGCTNIKKIVLPDTLKKIRTSAFSNCRNLESIDFGTGLTSIGGYADSFVFAQCENLKSIKLPTQMREIHLCAFRGCTKLSSVYLNDGLNLIDKMAFLGCNITEIHVPDSVTKLGYNSFGSVQKIYLKKNIPGTVKASTSFYANGFLELHIGDDIIHLPKALNEDSVTIIEEMFQNDYGNINFEEGLYTFAMDTEVKQYVALKTYQKTQNKSIKTYLKRVSKSLALRLISIHLDEDFLYLLNADLLSDTALADIFDSVKDNAVLCSYVLKKLNNSKNVGFSL